jgi:hypothetical protein
VLESRPQVGYARGPGHGVGERELAFLAKNFSILNGNTVAQTAQSVAICFSDASGSGYGGYEASCGSAQVRGRWTPEEAGRSSTWRELEAVYRTLQAIQRALAGKNVKWCSDNQAASKDTAGR